MSRIFSPLPRHHRPTSFVRLFHGAGRIPSCPPQHGEHVGGHGSLNRSMRRENRRGKSHCSPIGFGDSGHGCRRDRWQQLRFKETSMLVLSVSQMDERRERIEAANSWFFDVVFRFRARHGIAPAAEVSSRRRGCLCGVRFYRRPSIRKNRYTSRLVFLLLTTAAGPPQLPQWQGCNFGL